MMRMSSMLPAFALLAVALSGGAVWTWLPALVALCARFALKLLPDRAL
jgi:ceramide glucosyltransferase